jgi:S-adenosylmethionine:tRNA ribosyltransferase-isomerase
MGLKTEAFDYPLPKEFIAQHPETDRAGSRMLVLRRNDGSMEHRRFSDIVEFLKPHDVVVINDTKVLPARLKGRKPTGGVLDILLVEKIDGERWTCLVDGAKRGTAALDAMIDEVPVRLEREDGFWRIDFLGASGDEVMARHGAMPLPHYIRRGENGHKGIDVERYQTIYAEKPGSIAAPTAGLHFTEALLDRIRQMGVTVLKITLHIDRAG